ncbi:MAG: hypothetical protein ACRC67_43695 [Inquilinus sp.]|uniref:hypothetical protein n=1 Tax=Inquilinus sp. TaxID=1932117 RepID=UPI003F3508DF
MKSLARPGAAALMALGLLTLTPAMAPAALAATGWHHAEWHGRWHRNHHRDWHRDHHHWDRHHHNWHRRHY